MEENRTVFGHRPDGTQVDQITLRSGDCTCQIITCGGAVRSLTVPDKDGNPVDVVLGFDSVEDYLAQDGYIGALVGRCANRIGGAKFTLNGKVYKLAANDGANSLHGGGVGFDRQVWNVAMLCESAVILTLTSPDGQEGYPGAMDVRVTYALSNNGLTIDYTAKCDQDTVCNLTNHSYFNLSGHNSGSVENQQIKLFASNYTPTVPGSIPTGIVAPVAGTVMDLRTLQPIGAHIDEPFDQLAMAGGYDHNWAIDGWDGTLRRAALAWSPDTDIAMEVLTTLPGIQFYTGNFLTGSFTGKGGVPYQHRNGFCLETQYYPDAPNQPLFPSCVLRAGEEYHSTTSYHFSTGKPELS